MKPRKYNRILGRTPRVGSCLKDGKVLREGSRWNNRWNTEGFPHEGFWVQLFTDGSRYDPLCWVLGRILSEIFRTYSTKKQKRVLLRGKAEEPFMVLVFRSSFFECLSSSWRHSVASSSSVFFFFCFFFFYCFFFFFFFVFFLFLLTAVGSEMLNRTKRTRSPVEREVQAASHLDHISEAALCSVPSSHSFYIKMWSSPQTHTHTHTHTHCLCCSEAEVARLHRGPRAALHHVHVAAPSPGFPLRGGTEGWARVIFDSQLKRRCSGQEDESSLLKKHHQDIFKDK